MASPSWIRGRDMGFFDADDMSSVAGDSEISSTLSYMGGGAGMRRYHAHPLQPRRAWLLLFRLRNEQTAPLLQSPSSDFLLAKAVVSSADVSVRD